MSICLSCGGLGSREFEGRLGLGEICEREGAVRGGDGVGLRGWEFGVFFFG